VDLVVARNFPRFQIPQLLAIAILYKLGNLDDNNPVHCTVHRATNEQSKNCLSVDLVHVEVGHVSAPDGLGVELHYQLAVLDHALPFLNPWHRR
jgi:hypothetical protein